MISALLLVENSGFSSWGPEMWATFVAAVAAAVIGIINAVTGHGQHREVTAQLNRLERKANREDNNGRS